MLRLPLLHPGRTSDSEFSRTYCLALAPLALTAVPMRAVRPAMPATKMLLVMHDHDLFVFVLMLEILLGIFLVDLFFDFFFDFLLDMPVDRAMRRAARTHGPARMMVMHMAHTTARQEHHAQNQRNRNHFFSHPLSPFIFP